MASYTKQMIDIATGWLATNPDQDSPFLKVPGFHKHRRDALSDLRYYEKQARGVPEAQPLLERLREITPEYEKTHDELEAKENEYERLINKPFELGHTKGIVDTNHHSDIGRWCLAWARHGYNTFELTADFVAAILLTDGREIDLDEVKMPFHGILMTIPDSFVRGVEGTSYTKIHITEVTQSHNVQLDVTKKIVDLLIDQPKEAVQRFLTAERKKVDEKLAQEKPNFITCKSSNTIARFHLYATDGARVIETWIDRKDLSWSAFDELEDTFDSDIDRQASIMLRQIVFGALTFMTAVKDSLERVEPPTPRKPSDKPAATRWALGRTIKIEPELVRSVRAGSREVTFRLKHRHIVRGHYRNQAHGEGHKLRTRKWIAPFWKGPQEGAALVHTYKIEKT